MLKPWRSVGFANVMSTVAVFVALGGGAWAAGGSLLSGSGAVHGCVPKEGGVLTVVPVGARCGRGRETVELTRFGTTPVGLQGPAGPRGPAGPGAVSIEMGPTSDGPVQSIAAVFGGNQMRLSCGGGTCAAQLAVGADGMVMGTDQRGSENGRATETTMTSGQTPGIVTLTAASGPHSESEGHATLLTTEGTWHVDVELLTDALGNVRLIGTAVPAAITSVGHCIGGGMCPYP